MSDREQGSFIGTCIAASAAITAVAGATTLAYFIFQGIRTTRIEALLDSSFLVLSGMMRSFASADPIVLAWAVPLAFGFIAVIVLFIYRYIVR